MSDMEQYEREVKERVAELDVDDELRDILLEYFLVIAKMNYHAISSLRKRVLPDISLFIEFLAKKKGATLTVDDLDLSKLKSHTIINYLKSRTKSLEVQRVINSFISVFGRWLDHEGYITKFAYVKIPKPDTPPTKKRELELGTPRKLEEIDKLFSVIDVPTPRVPKERLPMYRFFAKLLLISGLRPKHLLFFKVGDLESNEIASDCFGNEYVVLPSYDIVKREKEALGEMIKKKKPAPYMYVHKSLHAELQSYCLDKGWDYDDPLIPVPLRSLENRMVTVRKMTSIKDFTWYDLRNTWASVIYNATAPKGATALVELGGWSSSEIAVDVYVKAMDSLEAVEMAQKYHIFIPPVYKRQIERILKGKKIEVTPEEIEKREAELAELRKMVSDLAKEIEELKKK